MSENGVLRFRTNIAEELALKFATGLISKTKYPDKGYEDQMMFTLTNDQRIYVPLHVGEKINGLGIQPGERFLVAKMETKNGQRRAIEWQVRRIDQPQSGPAQPAARPPAPPHPTAARPPARRQPPPPPPGQDYTQAFEQSITQAQQQRKAQQPSHQPGVTTAAPPASPSASGQNGRTQNNTSGRVTAKIAASAPPEMPEPPLPEPPAELRRNGSAAPQQPPPMKVPYHDAMTHFLIQAGRATREAERVLGAEGGSVRFDSRDVCALATSLLIHAGGDYRERRNWLCWDGWNGEPDQPKVGGAK